MSLLTCYLKYGSHLARLHRRRRRRCRRRRAHAPTSNTASRDNHEKINSWVSFCFPYMGCLWFSAWWAARAPLKTVQTVLRACATYSSFMTFGRVTTLSCFFSRQFKLSPTCFLKPISTDR